MEENNLGWYVKNSFQPLTEDVRAAKTFEYVTVNKNEFRKR